MLMARNRDYLGGALMTLLGLGVAIEGRSYDVGTLAEMGPGFFPVALGIILALLGLCIVVTAGGSDGQKEGSATEKKKPEWRGWICIVLAIVIFVIVGRWGGLVPASLISVFVASMGDRKNTRLSASALSIGVCLFSIAVFYYGLKIQLPLFAWGT